ncbi:metallopeptidase TldD-related protein [Pseudorhodoferax sp. Leaf274]|uniref:metallopeptidase TldD-related protein n=1 Tax=Pseudorhodoferax sp. Leaf274 TaxID=1736318 RepID=UPI0007035F44|nr:metallopeptidase TldD-related protein [Pseudorhodoferax sp. Leaf274]KQP36180.1 hypothetical protein ASF44_16570 [Pseudorhodoferax sp. Leaf274]
MSDVEVLQEARFARLADALFDVLAPGEALALNLDAEDSLFLRLNAGRLRQNTEVQQARLALLLQRDGRSVECSGVLSGRPARDLPAVLALLAQARAQAAQLPPDPHLVALRDEGRSHAQFTGNLPSAAQVLHAMAAHAGTLDLAGLYAGGSVVRGHRSSCGSAHWFGTQSFFLDYSLYEGQRAAKGVYAGTAWEPEAWSTHLAHTAAQLALLRRPAQHVAPGAWRTWLAPQAFAELVGMLGWRGLSADAWKQGRSPMKRLIEGELQLSPLLQLDENFGMGLAPRFNSRGETSPERLPLLAGGRLQNLLVSARTAREHGLVANGADAGEFLRAPDIAPGSLAQDAVLQALGTGLYVANLHYLNWSDPASARVTGMTRYACFWVQDGEIAGPLAADLRWDQSLYEALGPQQLLALSRETEIAPATSTYSQRALGGMRAPGALVEGFRYTL